MVLFWVVHISWKREGFGFEFCAGVPLFSRVAPVRALAVGAVGKFEVRFGHGRSRGNLRGVWVELF